MDVRYVGMPDEVFIVSSIISIITLIVVLEIRRNWTTANTLRKQFTGVVGSIAAVWTIVVFCWWLAAWYAASGSYEQIYGSDSHYVGHTYLHWSLLTAGICASIVRLTVQWFNRTSEVEPGGTKSKSLASP